MCGCMSMGSPSSGRAAEELNVLQHDASECLSAENASDEQSIHRGICLDHCYVYNVLFLLYIIHQAALYVHVLPCQCQEHMHV